MNPSASTLPNFDDTIIQLFRAYQSRDAAKATECFTQLQVDPATLETRVQLLFSENAHPSDPSKALNSFKNLVETVRIIPSQDVSKCLRVLEELSRFDSVEKPVLQTDLTNKILNSSVEERSEILHVAKLIESFIQPSHYGKQWALDFAIWLPPGERLEIGHVAEQLAQKCPALKSQVQPIPFRIQQRCAVMKSIALLPRNERLETILATVPLIKLIGLKPREIDSLLKVVNLNLKNQPNTTVEALLTFCKHTDKREILDFESIFTFFNTLDARERISFAKLATGLLDRLKLSFNIGIETLRILSYMQEKQREDVAARLEKCDGMHLLAHILYLIAPTFREKIVEFYRINPHLCLFGLKEQLAEIFKDSATKKASTDYLAALFKEESGHAKFYRLLQPYILQHFQSLTEQQAPILKIFEESRTLCSKAIEPKATCPTLDLSTCPTLPIVQMPVAPQSPKVMLRATNEGIISRN